MPQSLSHKRPTPLTQFYYGAAYYPEHWDFIARDLDAYRMHKAGINVVRMAEFAWDYLEPEEGVFQFELFDKIIPWLGTRGVSTILCTPTAAPPRWLTVAHPDVLRVDEHGVTMQHGSRQHACHTSPVFRAYSRAITKAMADHYADNPLVVGWQTDNEFNCHFSECHCENCQAAFREFLREKYQDDIAALNTAWGTAFWAQTYRSFDEIITPKNARPAYPNPAQQLDYFRFISWSVTRFQHEQVEILRAANPAWFVTHNGTFRHIDYRGPFTQDLDFLGYDVYPFFDPDALHRPLSQAFNLDYTRAWSGNFIVPEQQSGPGGQAPYFHDNPEPGELRRMVYTSIAHGADSLLFFRWRTCRFGAEAYWCGIFDHENVTNRRFDEVKSLGAELKKVGPEVLGTHVRVDVGIAAADMDVEEAHTTYTLGLPSPREVAARVHAYYYEQGYAVGCVHPSDDLSALKAYFIPHWAVFNPDWVPNLQAYVENGGLLTIGARTGTKNWHNNVIAETPPGVLKSLAGVKVMEYGRQNAPEQRPLAIHFPKSQIPTQEWYEVLENLPGTAIIGRWKGRRLDNKAAVAMKRIGKGAVVYVGTYLSEDILPILTALCAELTGLAPLWDDLPEGVHVVVREDATKRLWFFLNDSDTSVRLTETPPGVDCLTGKPLAVWAVLSPHQVFILKETLEPPADDSDLATDAPPPPEPSA